MHNPMTTREQSSLVRRTLFGFWRLWGIVMSLWSCMIDDYERVKKDISLFIYKESLYMNMPIPVETSPQDTKRKTSN